MNKYIIDRATKLKDEIGNRAKKEFETENFKLFYDKGMWCVKVFIDKDDVMDYNVIRDENGRIDFEIKE